MVNIASEWVEFRFFRPEATQVHLVGDFNNWRIGELVMAQAEDGYWWARLQLPPGEFRFRYYADGRWYTDYAACGIEPGEHGFDSVVCVPKRSRVIPVATPSRKEPCAVA